LQSLQNDATVMVAKPRSTKHFMKMPTWLVMRKYQELWTIIEQEEIGHIRSKHLKSWRRLHIVWRKSIILKAS